MEGQVTISLKEYTDLIIENNSLKILLSQYQRKIESDTDNKIYSSKINAMQSIEEVNKLLDSSDEKLLEKFTDNYSWTWENISEENYSIATTKEVKELAVSLIKKRLNCRLNDLLDIERDKENENE